MTPEPATEIGDYIRANRDRYTREALDAELRAAGHEQAAIDAAWGALPRSRAAAPVPVRRVVATVQFWALLLSVACIALTVLPVLSIFAVTTITSFASTSGSNVFDSGLAAALIALAPLLLGYLAIGLGGWWLRRRDRAAASGVFGGLIVAFVLSVIVAGACAAIIAQL